MGVKAWVKRDRPLVKELSGVFAPPRRALLLALGSPWP